MCPGTDDTLTTDYCLRELINELFPTFGNPITPTHIFLLGNLLLISLIKFYPPRLTLNFEYLLKYYIVSKYYLSVKFLPNNLQSYERFISSPALLLIV